VRSQFSQRLTFGSRRSAGGQVDAASHAGFDAGMTDRLDFGGRTALVVGGSSGIGNGIAQAFRAAGADVHVWGTRAAARDYSAAEGSDMTGLGYARMDVADFDAIAAWPPPFDRLDVLVLSQGMVVYRRGEFEIANFRRVVDINLNSLMACAEKFQPMLAQSSGALIIVSSTAAFHATVGNPAYNASKTGALGLTRTLGQAWAPLGIRVNGIAPGMVDTKMTAATFDNPERADGVRRRIPLGRFGTPADMADAALFLASGLSSYIVGQTLVVDGGLTG
jgi:3-oxoacyl-[acyl-carrier protein] reductase